jgi:hypothetical protein
MGVMDEVKNVNSSKVKIKFYTRKIESLCQTLSDSAGRCLVLPESAHLHQSVSSRLCPVEPDIVLPGMDIVRNLNLSPMASFFGETYKYPSTSNGSPLLA